MTEKNRKPAGVLYDTAVLIRAERNGADPKSLLDGKRDGPASISVVSVAELLHGAHRADTEERRSERLAFVERLCERFTVFDYDIAAARIFAEIWSRAATQGISVGIHDMIIAATAMSRGFSVLTINRKDFEHIEGLRLEVLETEKQKAEGA